MKRRASHSYDNDMQDAHRRFHQTCKAQGLGAEHIGPNNPAQSAAQQRFMGADLARARAGKKTRTGMSAAKLEEMARKPAGGY